MTPSRTPGRPRSEEADRSIIDATFTLIRDVGYDALTIEAVASEAGVGKTTIYRRYADKADLVSASLAASLPMPVSPQSGDPKSDLASLVSLFQHGVVEGLGMTFIGTMVAHEDSEPELMAMFRERVTGPRRAVMRGVLQDAVASGALRDDLDLEQVVDVLVGAVVMRRIAAGSIPDDFSERLVDLIWRAVSV